MTTIYLAGPINGCTDEECRGWREAAKASLPGFTFLDPMDRDYRGIEDQNVLEIVRGDLEDIKASDVVLVNAERASWGTAMEVVYATQYRKRVIAFGTDKPSPWLRAHSHGVLPSIAVAVVAIKAWASIKAQATKNEKDGGYSCPSCAEIRTLEVLDAARAALECLECVDQEDVRTNSQRLRAQIDRCLTPPSDLRDGEACPACGWFG